MGPTAAGKTDLAVELVQRRDCEIISVDSALIYRDMNIGSAKPDAATLALAPHHLINIRDAAEAYSAADFRRDALLLMQQITQRGKVPLLVGGTMMYYKALMEGLAPLPESEPAMRAQLEHDIAQHGLAVLHQRLCVIDPVAGARINATDPQRITRAMEVYLLSGETLTSHWQRQQQQQLPYNVASIGVWPPERALLHQRIEQRFALMLQQGFEAEVALFMQRGDLSLNMPSMRCVGYRQMWQYLAGEYDYATMEHKGVVATRQLAKRQLTWLRSWPDLQVFDSLDTKLSFNVLQLFDRMRH
ncbi:MAG: tRNA (adenosine(37)-N6)-dimethylallyltransferase MiaA [Oceanospirillaceae bacterium]|jgi:tRNA dimethylallyltransferase|nr:tRNA (adenosine(37)-N6)-dimethylallyltransferase MiaA [Oceanospirillaceae bacterium]MBT4442797.1 tRNA (adenosine(37)-N6)-dimethylallyltransferase MiaA [Oceanospirillaceae bacterium]MBT6077754.1 tRNA (adenosine(37)-N6)-dimethylallyltransferase MiaA [Oceanospirillaceae bacterium]MBT7329577.1 tRNA (adenosine(37)-N6)-dimethylallyltransferase MiaA [Oceanospirillaceae bacterium]